jgi:predicted CXXCH cytochrome family protein
MKRTAIVFVIAALCVAAPGMSQSSVVGSKHDLSGAVTTSDRVCVFCHTPHQPDSPFFDADPLWNHTLSTNPTYGVYDSTTLNASPAEIGGGTTVSNLCLSCHDGTIGICSLYNNPNISGGEETPTNSGTLMSGNALVGTDLTNDHPVNFDYTAALASEDGGLVDPSGAGAPGDWLFGDSLQCASCHDPHDDTYLPFLVADNAFSAMCLTCHIK